MDTSASDLAGYWRWESMRIEFADGAPAIDVYGEAPDGGVMFTSNGRIMALISTQARSPAATDDDRLALFRSFAAYTGRFRIQDGNRFVTIVDAAWDPAWSGEQERFFAIEGDKFIVRTGKQTHPSFPGRELYMIGVARRTAD